MAHTFIELDKAVVRVIHVWLVFRDCGFQSVCPLLDKDKRLMEASRWEGLIEGETGSCLPFGSASSFFMELFLLQ